MIGVLARPDQTSVVEEFFELFKTPWEFYRDGCPYDVVFASTDCLAEVDAQLLVVCGSEAKRSDALNGIHVESLHRGETFRYRNTCLPIYGPVAVFDGGAIGAEVVGTTSAGAVGLRISSERRWIIRLGYDVFDEVKALLGVGQPVENSHVPALDIHIEILRDFMLDAGISFLEIPPIPAGHNFAVCLTHDIDFVGIRNHKFDHTMWGFLYRSIIGGIKDLFRRRISLERLLRMWRAVASLPLVYLGWARDFWNPFEWYLNVERHMPAT